MVEDVLYEDLQKELKQLQKDGDAPEWMQTVGWQMLRERYIWSSGGERTPKEAYTRVATTAAKQLPPSLREKYESKFFDLMWKGWLSPSTPVLANMGTDRGLPVSCSGNYVSDDLYEIYHTVLENALLSKNGFGTSSYLSDIRAKGSVISSGGSSNGVVDWFDNHVEAAKKVSQGSTRRGAWAGYIDIAHPDFDDLVSYVIKSPDKVNVGFNYTDEFLELLKKGNREAVTKRERHLWLRMVTGRGYYYFPDKVQRMQSEAYKQNGLVSKASNLCTEINLFSDKDHTFTCVLSSMNAAKFDEWKDTDAVQTAIVFLDCVASEFIVKSIGISGLEKSIRFTMKGRALGLGLFGFHTYLQSKTIAMEELQAQFENRAIFKHMDEESKKATRFLAKELGEPEWCKGLGVRNTHLLAVAPNTSSALICGSISQGIEPMMNVFTQKVAGGSMFRVNPMLVQLLKAKGKFDDKVIESIGNSPGSSVAHLDFLTDHEKLVFKSPFEVNQKRLIQLASQRQEFIDQAQSINLFFSESEDRDWISQVHEIAEKDPMIKSLYYVRSQAGVQASKDDSCVACEG